MFVLHATLIFTCGQWSRWCERRICHAWLSSARPFLSTFWQEFICISCCICWMFNRSVGCCFGPGSGWVLLRWPAPKPTVENNPLCSNVRWIFIEDNYGSVLEERIVAPKRKHQQRMTLNQFFCFFISNYSVRCFADEIPATLEIFLHGGVFAGSAPVQPIRCERDHISKVHQLIMNTFTQPVLIVYLFFLVLPAVSLRSSSVGLKAALWSGWASGDWSHDRAFLWGSSADKVDF